MVPQLMGFLRGNKGRLEKVTGVRYSGERGHPFHVVDGEIVILRLDDPFIPEGRFASLLVRDKALARQLADGFKELWGAGFPPPFAEAVLRHYAAVKEGRMRASFGVRDALGREAGVFDDWARDNAAALK